MKNWTHKSMEPSSLAYNTKQMMWDVISCACTNVQNASPFCSWLFYPGQVKCKYLGGGRGGGMRLNSLQNGFDYCLGRSPLAFQTSVITRIAEDCFTTNTTFKNVVIMHRPAMRTWRTRTRYGSASVRTLWAVCLHTASSRVSSWHRSELQEESNLEWGSPGTQYDMSEKILWLQRLSILLGDCTNLREGLVWNASILKFAA